jgi:hypothetical protein
LNKSCPRNHFYRTSELIENSPGNGAVLIRVLCQMDHPGDVAYEAAGLRPALAGAVKEPEVRPSLRSQVHQTARRLLLPKAESDKKDRQYPQGPGRRYRRWKLLSP